MQHPFRLVWWRGPKRAPRHRFGALAALIGLVTAAGSLSAATNAVSWNDPRQSIDGFGISEAFHQSRHLMNWPEADRARILKLLFSTEEGVGVSILRNIIGDGGTWGNDMDGPTPTIEPAEGTWSWTGDEDQIWLMQQARKLGCSRFVSTVWSPPAWMKTIPTVQGGGSLRPEKYGAFAEYLSRYAREYKMRFGLNIYAVSLQNEPDLETKYSSCRWTGDQFRDFIKCSLKPVFARDGVQAQVMLGEMSNFGERCAEASLNDLETVDRVDIDSTHADDKDPAKREGILPFARSKGKRVWMTEVSYFEKNDPGIADGLRWAKLMHDHLTVTEVNAWLYWWGACYKTNGESLITLDLPARACDTTKRLYTFGNFSRFVRPGFVRLGAEPHPAPDVSASAYKDPDTGDFALVAINMGTSIRDLDLAFEGFKTGRLRPFRTSATEDLKALPRVSLVKGRLVTRLAPQSVTTFIGKGKPSGSTSPRREG